MNKDIHSMHRSKEDLEREFYQILSSISLNESQRRQIMNVPPMYRLQYVKALTMQGKRALAVKMKCYECMGWESLRDRVGNCTIRLCPLWLHRPFQKQDESELENE